MNETLNAADESLKILAVNPFVVLFAIEIFVLPLLEFSAIVIIDVQIFGISLNSFSKTHSTSEYDFGLTSIEFEYPTANLLFS